MLGKQAHVLYDDGKHRCLMFYNLAQGKGIQTNQFLITDRGRGALIDPGGELTFAPLTVAVSNYINLADLDYILASDQDPDAISSLGRWLMQTQASVVCSHLWARFLPHLASQHLDAMHDSGARRILALPDRGGCVTVGGSDLYVIPAHFLHSVGSFNFYDQKSKILFSGDIGSSPGVENQQHPVEDFDQHAKSMKAFHQRYMCSNKVCRLWAEMVTTLDIRAIVPQHGKRFEGENMGRFLDWMYDLKCGVDIVNQKDFQARLIPPTGLHTANAS